MHPQGPETDVATGGSPQARSASPVIPDRLTPHLVTVGLLDGTTRVGRVARRFAPRDPNLMHRGRQRRRRPPHPCPPPRRARLLRGLSAPLAGRSQAPRCAIAWCARSTSRRRLAVVEASVGAFQQPLGFYAVPHDPASPFDELFFYAHGVNHVEDPELLGSMLVADGVLAPGDARARPPHAQRPPQRARRPDPPRTGERRSRRARRTRWRSRIATAASSARSWCRRASPAPRESRPR